MGISRVVLVPVRCPGCGTRGEVVGLPRLARAKAVLRCPKCGKEWVARMRNYPDRDRGRRR
ncbi:MAG: hypothetical protein HY905_07175 [Deltaproteobacteria bacterium]|nr:hypothetical protein [Deltaproteobacteria bacterium]